MSVLVYGDLPDVRAGEVGHEISPALGWYFAGLVDGEGCFSIEATRCTFILKLRDDDRGLLEYLRDCLNVGDIGIEQGRTSDRTRRPQARWSIHRKAELVWLTELFDVYELKGKKFYDYRVWREAVIAWANSGSPRVLAGYRDALREVRAYDSPSAEAPFPESPLAKPDADNKSRASESE